MKIYMVVMYRWGDRDEHSYLLGAFDSPVFARREGEKENMSRGGKYDYEIVEFVTNDLSSRKVIFRLEDHING